MALVVAGVRRVWVFVQGRGSGLKVDGRELKDRGSQVKSRGVF